MSDFLSAASQSFEEDEGRDPPHLRRPSALRGPARMSGEGNHGNRPAQRTGVEKHRWDTLQICLFEGNRRDFGGSGETLMCGLIGQ